MEGWMNGETRKQARAPAPPNAAHGRFLNSRAAREFIWYNITMPSPLPLNLDDVRALTAPFQPSVVYLYGSAARGALRPGSDIDLALVPAAPCDPVALYDAAQELAIRCGRDVDLVDASQATAVLRAQIVGYGRRVLVNDLRRADEFEMYALSNYAYANERRHNALAAFLRPYHAR